MSNIELPDSWESPQIRDCSELNPRIDKSETPDAKTVHFVPMPAVEALINKVDVSATRPFGEVKKGYTPFQSADVIFAKITPCMENGKIAVVPKLEHDLALGSTEFHVIRPCGDLPPLWFFYYLSSRSYRSEAEHNMTGAVGQRRVPIDFIAQSKIPLPPLAEQKRIVAKIEELFSELDAGEESLRRARQQLSVYRQSLLKQAFEGKLTAPWRAHNPDLLESPDQLLARIQAERQKNWSGRGKCRPAKPPKLDEESPLPAEWTYVSVDQAALNFDGQRVPLKRADRDKRSGQYPYYGASGIIDDIDDYLFDGEYLLIAEDGANLVSRSTAIAFQAHGKFWVNNHAHIVQTIAGIPLRYLELFLNGKDLSRFISGSAQPKLTQANLNQVPVPLCSLPEQQKIVRLLDEQFEVVEQNEREIDAALKRSEALRQSILKKAFTGQLITQDPTDEPASTLLARIREEREAAAKLAKPRTKLANKKTARTRSRNS